MIFDPCNWSLKIWESIGTTTPKVGTHLGVWGFVHSPTLPRAWDVSLGLPSWPAPLQALALVVSPRLGLRQAEWVFEVGWVAVVLVFGFVKDEQTFSTFAFTKDKLCNRLGLHLDTNVACLHKNFILKKASLSWGYYSLEGSESPNWFCFLESSVFFTTQNSSVHVSMIWTSLVIVLGFL